MSEALINRKLSRKSSAASEYNTRELTASLANIIASVIDDAIDQLYILGAGMVPKNTIKIDDIATRAAKYIQEDPIFDHETGDPFEEAFNKKKMLKLYFDSSKISELLIQLRMELKTDRHYDGLVKFLEDVKRSKEEENELFEDEKRNFDAMNLLKQTLLNEQRDRQEYLRELNEEIAVLKDEAEVFTKRRQTCGLSDLEMLGISWAPILIHFIKFKKDVLFENLIRVRYIDNWQQSRDEQNDLSCYQKENELETIINKYKEEIEKEARVNTEIEMYIAENQKDMEDEIEEWMEKYEKDSESRIVEIAVIKEKREDLEIEYNNLKELYESRQQQIEDYLAYKEIKRIEQERFEQETEAAIKIQAWWRGLMVRLKLGPYNPNKKKGKKGKDKKGKGKKK